MKIEKKKIIFWDFDGVIKESIEAKASAFESLFFEYGIGLTGKIRAHHNANGGMSRYEKIPIYLKWANLSDDDHQVERYAQNFSDMVIEEVIKSPWVPGAREYLSTNHDKCYFVLLSATPIEELVFIIRRLSIFHCFREIYGSPTIKANAINNVLNRLKINGSDALVIGDSVVDLLAAEENSVPFLLRRNSNNEDLQLSYDGPQINNFIL
jgi:phosphoglycolate phosphatase-like HAD superfamily hydrolase